MLKEVDGKKDELEVAEALKGVFNVREEVLQKDLHELLTGLNRRYLINWRYGEGPSFAGVLYQFFSQYHIRYKERFSSHSDSFLLLYIKFLDEAMPAFDSGAIDAWSIWEPFLSLKTIKSDADILVDGEQIDKYSPGFTLVRSKFAEQHPDEVIRFLKVYDKAVKWQKTHKKEAVEAYAKIKNLDKEVVENVLNNHSWSGSL